VLLQASTLAILKTFKKKMQVNVLRYFKRGRLKRVGRGSDIFPTITLLQASTLAVSC